MLAAGGAGSITALATPHYSSRNCVGAVRYPDAAVWREQRPGYAAILARATARQRRPTQSQPQARPLNPAPDCQQRPPVPLFSLPVAGKHA